MEGDLTSVLEDVKGWRTGKDLGSSYLGLGVKRGRCMDTERHSGRYKESSLKKCQLFK